jgi:hypothetical protein
MSSFFKWIAVAVVFTALSVWFIPGVADAVEGIFQLVVLVIS